MSTTSTVVVAADGRSVLLVDPAWLPDDLAALGSSMRSHGFDVVAGFATHAHHDHLLWHPDLGDVPRWASPRTAELAATFRAELVAALGPGWPEPLVDLLGRVRPAVAAPDGTTSIPLLPPGLDAELLVHDGHCSGHTAVWLPRTRTLLAGDMLSDVELPLPLDPDDLPAYLAALDRLAPLAARADVVVPGHGSPGTDAARRLDADRRYLDALLAGQEPDDPRIAHPGMAQVHARVAALARRGQ